MSIGLVRAPRLRSAMALAGRLAAAGWTAGALDAMSEAPDEELHELLAATGGGADELPLLLQLIASAGGLAGRVAAILPPSRITASPRRRRLPELRIWRWPLRRAVACHRCHRLAAPRSSSGLQNSAGSCPSW